MADDTEQITMQSVIDDIERQLAWRGPSGKPCGYVALRRLKASVALGALVTKRERYVDEIDRLRAGMAAIKKATIDGRVCNDVAWFDEITTLHDFCDQFLQVPK
jgi:hypothetical protein